MFQGGFAGKDCEIWILSTSGEFEKVLNFYPEDSNKMQQFAVDLNDISGMKIVFKSSTDFYGRIVVYHLDLE
jgi:hypothetical protein